jgi:hypothetical protein
MTFSLLDPPKEIRDPQHLVAAGPGSCETHGKVPEAKLSGSGSSGSSGNSRREP